ncbi:hypothetical protein chiPu_0029309, partial [Chiloscyllium punctatum]|nr:hypothetical protein [Chiloscyllium punctatum]
MERTARVISERQGNPEETWQEGGGSSREASGSECNLSGRQARPSGPVMGLCKCPKRRVTNLFCYEHRVNVCEHCLISRHYK